MTFDGLKSRTLVALHAVSEAVDEARFVKALHSDAPLPELERLTRLMQSRYLKVAGVFCGLYAQLAAASLGSRGAGRVEEPLGKG